MKKILVILMALVMLLSCFAALAEETAVEATPAVDLSEYVGAWRPVLVDLGYGPMENEGYEGGELVINEDGTATYTRLDVEYRSEKIEKQESDGNIIIAITMQADADGKQPGMAVVDYPEYEETYMGGQQLLIAPGNNALVIYSREFELAEEQPAVRTDVVPADFDGRWAVKEGYVGDRVIPYEYEPILMGLGAVLRIDAENLSSEMHLLVGAKRINMDAEIVDGVFSGSIEEAPDTKIKCVLREDGTLKLTFDLCDFVYERAFVDALYEYTEKDIIKAVQEAMNAQGFDCGTPDGVAGKNTAKAISGFQAANGLNETGTATHETLKKLRDLGIDLIAQFDLDE